MGNSHSAEGVRLTGAPNFREIAGYGAPNGRRMRPGKVFRAGTLARLTDKDLEILDGLDIGSVFDLRSARERDHHPDRWPTGDRVELVNLDISNDLRAAENALERILTEDCSPQGAREVMLATYRRMPRAFVGRLPRIFEHLLTGQNILVHCTAGKDRTGFVAAMIMAALGIERAAIYDEYMLTAKQCDIREIAKGSASAIAAAMGRKEIDFNVVLVLSNIAPEYLDAAFAAIDEEFGSMENYLDAAGGLDAQKRARLQNVLLA